MRSFDYFTLYACLLLVGLQFGLSQQTTSSEVDNENNVEQTTTEQHGNEVDGEMKHTGTVKDAAGDEKKNEDEDEGGPEVIAATRKHQAFFARLAAFGDPADLKERAVKAVCLLEGVGSVDSFDEAKEAIKLAIERSDHYLGLFRAEYTMWEHEFNKQPVPTSPLKNKLLNLKEPINLWRMRLKKFVRVGAVSEFLEFRCPIVDHEIFLLRTMHRNLKVYFDVSEKLQKVFCSTIKMLKMKSNDDEGNEQAAEAKV